MLCKGVTQRCGADGRGAARGVPPSVTSRGGAAATRIAPSAHRQVVVARRPSVAPLCAAAAARHRASRPRARHPPCARRLRCHRMLPHAAASCAIWRYAGAGVPRPALLSAARVLAAAPTSRKCDLRSASRPARRRRPHRRRGMHTTPPTAVPSAVGAAESRGAAWSGDPPRALLVSSGAVPDAGAALGTACPRVMPRCWGAAPALATVETRRARRAAAVRCRAPGRERWRSFASCRCSAALSTALQRGGTVASRAAAGSSTSVSAQVQRQTAGAAAGCRCALRSAGAAALLCRLHAGGCLLLLSAARAPHAAVAAREQPLPCGRGVSGAHSALRCGKDLPVCATRRPLAQQQSATALRPRLAGCRPAAEVGARGGVAAGA